MIRSFEEIYNTSKLQMAILEADLGEIQIRQDCRTPTSPQNGGEKSIEYCQLKAAPFAGECQEVFVAAIFTLHAGKAVVQITTIEIPINHLLDVRPPELFRCLTGTEDRTKGGDEPHFQSSLLIMSRLY
jgi:hypothetical protein